MGGSRGYKTPGSWSLQDVRHAPAAALITEWKEAQMIPGAAAGQRAGGGAALTAAARRPLTVMNWRSVARFKEPALSDVTKGDDTCSVTPVLPPGTALLWFPSKCAKRSSKTSVLALKKKKK